MKNQTTKPTTASAGQNRAEHTPGPWRSVPSTAGGGVARLDIVSDGAEFSPSFVAGDILPGDAALISVAPELLAALEKVANLLAEHPEAEQGNSKVHFLMHAARAAIANAKGAAQ